MKKSICLLQTEYFPTAWFFGRCLEYDEVHLEAKEHYQKRSYRNRCQISGPNGPVWLSVPLLKGKHNQCPVTEVQIAFHEPWQSNHWNSIQTSYGKTPYFEHYADLVKSLVKMEEPLLFKRNLRIIRHLLAEMQLNSTIVLTDSYRHGNGKADDLRGENPVSRKGNPTAGQYPPYHQPFIHRQPFRPNLSILDLLFCKGPETIQYLEKLPAHLKG